MPHLALPHGGGAHDGETGCGAGDDDLVSAVDGAQNGWNLDDTVAFARELKARGVDVIDCSSGGISGSATAAQVPRGLGFQVPYAERVRRDVGIASMAVGIILEAQQAEAILENGQADLIARIGDHA